MKLLPAFVKRRNGFTLVELLVVASVIGILAGVTLTVINQNTIRARARDRQRQADLSKIAAALELYFTDNRTYPVSDPLSLNWIDIDPTTNALSSELNTYFPNYPRDPLYSNPVSTPCNLDGTSDGVTDYRYNYVTSTSGGIYILTAIMEDPGSDDTSKCVSLSNWTTLGAPGCPTGTATAGTPDYCYGIQNPF